MKLIRYPEALLFCIAWAVLALAGWRYGGWGAGLVLALGLFPIVMAASAYVLSRTGSFVQERIVRWSLLAIAALLLLIWVG